MYIVPKKISSPSGKRPTVTSHLEGSESRVRELQQLEVPPSKLAVY